MDTDGLRQSAGRGRRAQTPTAWTRVAAQVVHQAERAGIARAELIRRAGLADGDLADPDSRLPLTSIYALLEEMVELARDPLVHMRATRSFDLTALDALAFVVMTSPTFGAGLRAMLRHQRLFSDGESYHLVEEGEWARIVHHPWGPHRRGHALMAEMFAVDVLVNGGAMTGGPFEDARVELAGSAPDAVEEHRALLGGIAASFERPSSQVWIRRQDLARPLAPAGQEALCAFFERYLEERVRALPAAGTAGRARDLLLRGVAPDPRVESLARRLHMSARTLQRRLADEGTSVRELADEARRARAIPLLAGGASIAEVAHLLGFAEPSAFHRAFRRWTGRTPESYRGQAARSRSASRPVA